MSVTGFCTLFMVWSVVTYSESTHTHTHTLSRVNKRAASVWHVVKLSSKTKTDGFQMVKFQMMLTIPFIYMPHVCTKLGWLCMSRHCNSVSLRMTNVGKIKILAICLCIWIWVDKRYSVLTLVCELLLLMHDAYSVLLWLWAAISIPAWQVLS